MCNIVCWILRWYDLRDINDALFSGPYVFCPPEAARYVSVWWSGAVPCFVLPAFSAREMWSASFSVTANIKMQPSWKKLIQFVLIWSARPCLSTIHHIIKEIIQKLIPMKDARIYTWSLRFCCWSMLCINCAKLVFMHKHLLLGMHTCILMGLPLYIFYTDLFDLWRQF